MGEARGIEYWDRVGQKDQKDAMLMLRALREARRDRGTG